MRLRTEARVASQLVTDPIRRAGRAAGVSFRYQPLTKRLMFLLGAVMVLACAVLMSLHKDPQGVGLAGLFLGWSASIPTMTTVVQALLGYYPVGGYGADSTGATSSSAAFVAAEAAAFTTGGRVVAGAGTFLLGASWALRVPFSGAGPGRTTLTRNGNFEHITVTGTKAASISLSANATANATTLTFTDAAAISTISANDWLILRSTVTWPGGSGKTGETVRVGSKATNVLTLEGAIDETYATADSSVIEKLTPVVGVVLEGVTLQGTAATSTTGGAVFKYCRQLVVDNVECRDLDGPGFQVDTCVDWAIDKCWIHDLTDDSGNARYGYGVNCTGASRDGRVSRTNFRNCRHSFTTNGSTDGVPHHIKVENCEASGAGAIFDTHEEGRWITFENCTVHTFTSGGAFRSRSPDTRIIDPTVQAAGALAVEVTGARCSIEGGMIETNNQQCIRFESGAVDGRVAGTAMRNLTSGGGGGVRVDTGADRCIVQSISCRNFAECMSVNGGAGHHFQSLFVDNASNAIRVAVGATVNAIRDLDTVNCTTEINNSGTILNRGTATLVAGTVTVSNTLVKAGSRISLTVQSLGTVVAPKAIAVTARTAATSFTITSSDATDTSVVGWEIQAA